jgi:hypothetical protein
MFSYAKIGAKNYLDVPLPDIEVYFQTSPTIIPTTNTEGIARIWSNITSIKGELHFHDPAGIYADTIKTRVIDFNNSDIPEWVILEMNAYVPPQQDLT